MSEFEEIRGKTHGGYIVPETGGACALWQRNTCKRDRKNTKGKKTGRTNRNKPTEKKRGKKDGKKLNRNALYLIGIIVILFIVFLFVRKNGSAVYIADEQVGILETRKVTAKELTATLESQLEGIVGSKVQINEKIKIEGIISAPRRRRMSARWSICAENAQQG